MLARQDEARVRTPLMRVVRELAMSQAQEGDALFLHASCAVRDGVGAIVTGPKAYDKTTILFHELIRGSADYLANDRVLAWPEADAVRLRAMPTIVSIRPRTFEFFPQLHDGIFGRRLHYRATIAEADRDDGRSPEPWEDGRMGVTPAQVCVLTGSRRVPEAKACAIVFPRVVGNALGMALQPLPASVAAELLMDSVFGAGDWKGTSAMFGGQRSPRSSSQVRRLCGALADRLPSYVCELGPDAYGKTATTLHDLLVSERCL